MRITQQLEDLKLERNPIVLAVGSFDGFHRGHQTVMRHAVEKAKALGGEAWALTLDPHPLKVLKPETAPPLITSTPHKLKLMEPFGIGGCVVLPFTPALAAEEPAAFVERLHGSAPTLGEMVVGRNWTFGRGGRGNVTLLAGLAREKNFRITAVDSVLWEGKAISSTRIRQAVSEGKLDDAEQMLGRPFSILGTVVPGRHVGAQLGFPTANLDPHNEVRPPSGVYAAHVAVGSRQYLGAVFLAETDAAQSGPSGFILEVHILDFEMDLYGRNIEVFFKMRIREVRRFRSRMQLKEQIALDVRQVRERLVP